MTNAQLYTLLAPALVSLFGVFFAAWRTDKRLDDLRTDMNRQFDKVNYALELIQQDLTRFHGVQSAHEEAIATLKERVK